MRVWPCIPHESGEILDCSRHRSNSRPDTPSRDDAAGRQRFPATPRRARMLLPNPSANALTERENARPQIEQVPVRKNQKAAIVDHQLQARILLAEAPTDPAIACRALQCRGRKAQQRDPLLPPEDRKSTRLNSSHGYISYA